MLCIERKSDEIGQETFSIQQIREVLGIPHPRETGFIESLPFSSDDVTAGSETELQAAVCGRREHVDLPLVIESSNYFANVVKRAAAGDTPDRAVTDLERYLEGNIDGVWENSWVRFPKRKLSDFARQIFDSDMLLDKKNPESHLRADANKYHYNHTPVAGQVVEIYEIPEVIIHAILAQ